MENKDLIEKWLRRYLENEKKEAEEAKEKPVKEKKPKKIILPQAPDFKTASFLGDEFGKQINEKIQAKYKSLGSINNVVYDNKDKLMRGSTPFYVVAVNEILQEEFPQFRTATQADLEKIIKSNALDLSGHYEDSALVLRAKQDPNGYLAEDLFKQFNNKGRVLKEDSAYVLPLWTLKLRKDTQSPDKLSFNITDLTINNYFEAPVLMKDSGSYINPSEMNERTGLPTKVYNKSVSGNRRLWTMNAGLVRLCLDGDLGVGSYDGGLSGCGADGRVVLVSGEASAQKI